MTPMQITLTREQHELLTSQATPEELANPAKQTYHGGKLLDGRVKLYNIYLGTSPVLRSSFDTFSKDLVQGGYYRSPDGADTAPGTFLGSWACPWPFAGMTVGDGQISSWLDSIVASGIVPPQDGWTEYMLIFPANSTVTLPNGDASCSKFCGYHSKSQGGNFYSVLCDTSCPGCHGSVTPEQALQMVYAHEYGESRADPEGTGWYVDGGTFDGWENGDLCAWDAQPYGIYTVQPLATNDKGCYVGPEGNSAPPPVPQGVTTALKLNTFTKDEVVGVLSESQEILCLKSDGSVNTDDNITAVTAHVVQSSGMAFSQPAPYAVAVAGKAMLPGVTFQSAHSRLHWHYNNGGNITEDGPSFDVVASTPPPPVTKTYEQGVADGIAQERTIAKDALTQALGRL